MLILNINQIGQRRQLMNDKFYALLEEKQSQILNAAYKVFATNQYKKAPTSEIAAEAGISKSLLFHYFHNKQELYIFLWNYAADLTKNICVNIRYMKQMIFLK
jgi:AcrR family transcriptional regulator